MFDAFVTVDVAFLVPILVRMTCCLRSLCLHCGYDLTGNVSGVCPECGKPVLRAEEVG